MDKLSAAAAGLLNDRETSGRYVVHRDRVSGAKGVPRPPIVEEFLALDRARLAALSQALDGSTITGDRFTGTVRIVQVLYSYGKPSKPTLIDEFDERVASRLLNETRLPRAGQLAVSVDRLQGQIDGLNRD